ncbi:MAG: ABC transporter ATP-binding protein [Planctomycetes bacterium]|nr:ABC transporter ATP-binding protein [Planctomycetota bacterium]MBL7146186.1 ABC transporter ATP-binding protein [Phycisphaerae bacterium]
MKAIEVKTLSKWYGSARGVEDLSFSVEKGEIFGYLGPNGSGKTTTIRCLMGLLRPTSGYCLVSGERIMPGRGTQHTNIGYLPGEFRIWPGLTSRRSLGILARLGNGNNLSKRQEELAERLDLNLDRRVHTLSKGNRQKVGVLYAFQHQPDVLILDEPTIGLDPLVRQVVLELIREAAQAGATVLLSSHDLSEVAAVCGRAAILREGRLNELAPISRILQQGRKRLKVWFAEGTQIPSLPVDKLPGVRLIQQEPETLHLAYQGSIDPVLKWLSQYPVDRISTPETSLEEAFIQYYNKNQPLGVTKHRGSEPKEAANEQ